jgi:hypothetical protein
VDIEWHLARHAESIDFVTRRALAQYNMSEYTNPDEDEELRQALVELLTKRHASPSYDHDKFLLWTYVQPAVPLLVYQTLNQWPRTVLYSTDDESFKLIDAKQQRDEAWPINWHLRGKAEEEQESSLTTEEQKLAEKLMANLTDEELEVLDASVGRSIHQAAEILDMSYTTYYRRLRDAKARAKALAALEQRLTLHLGS